MTRSGSILLICFALCGASGCTGIIPEENIRPRGVDLYVAGVKAYQSGDTKLAQSRFEQATSVNPNLRMARSMLGDIYRSQGDYDRARQQYEILVKLDPYGSENYYRLGVTYQFLQRIEDAIASYLRALNIQPRDMRSSMNLGLCYLSLNQREDAVKYLRRATQLSPTWADAWTNLGVALDAQGDLAGAEKAYKRALELNRNQNLALLNLGANLIRQNKGGEAVSVMEEAIKRADNAPTRTRYGHALALAKRFSDALLQFQFALKFDPRYYPAHNERGTTLIAQYEKGLELDDNLRQQALEAWIQSLKIYPNQPPVRQAIKQWSGGRLIGQPSGS
jgi:tetratricopeptide (TPR) repeat protein